MGLPREREKKTLREEESKREGGMLHVVAELKEREAILTWFSFSQVGGKTPIP